MLLFNTAGIVVAATATVVSSQNVLYEKNLTTYYRSIEQFQSLSTQLDDVSISDLSSSSSSPPRAMPSLESEDLRFAFEKGRVAALCTEEEEGDPWGLNVKRGVLSAFQTILLEEGGTKDSLMEVRKHIAIGSKT